MSLQMASLRAPKEERRAGFQVVLRMVDINGEIGTAHNNYMQYLDQQQMKETNSDKASGCE
jgi:hypothetical protein